MASENRVILLVSLVLLILSIVGIFIAQPWLYLGAGLAGFAISIWQWIRHKHWLWLLISLTWLLYLIVEYFA
jgi:hypothetical protein